VTALAGLLRAAARQIRAEPVMTLALVQAAVVCGVAFGLDLTDTQTAAVLGLAAAGLGLLARSKVTPTSLLLRGGPPT